MRSAEMPSKDNHSPSEKQESPAIADKPRTTRKSAKNYSNSTCLQRCH